MMKRNRVLYKVVPKRPIITQSQSFPAITLELKCGQIRADDDWYDVFFNQGIGIDFGLVNLPVQTKVIKACLVDVSGVMYSILYVPLNCLHVGFFLLCNSYTGTGISEGVG